MYRTDSCDVVGHRWEWCGVAGDFSWKNLTSYVCTKCYMNGTVEYDTPEIEAKTRNLVRESLEAKGLWNDQW